ncbi:MAG: hypothetical protein H0V12_07780 [Chloroflexi bacterium]|jgi:hypothetical protein|nr:hypothetical protein [Chloroflexota bacterium]
MADDDNHTERELSARPENAMPTTDRPLIVCACGCGRPTAAHAEGLDVSPVYATAACWRRGRKEDA